jgi:hypothetical protein
MRMSGSKNKAQVPTRETVTIMMMVATALATVVLGVVEVHRLVVAALDGWVLSYDDNPTASAEAATRANRALALLDADTVAGFALIAGIAAFGRERLLSRVCAAISLACMVLGCCGVVLWSAGRSRPRWVLAATRVSLDHGARHTPPDDLRCAPVRCRDRMA